MEAPLEYREREEGEDEGRTGVELLPQHLGMGVEGEEGWQAAGLHSLQHAFSL